MKDSSYEFNSKPKSISLHASTKVRFSNDLRKSNFTSKFSVEEVLRKRSFKSLHAQHNKAVEKNDDDYDNDLLLGNLSKSLFLKKNLDKKLHRQKPLKESIIVKDDPFIYESPANFVKQPYFYNKNFKEAFSSYLKGEIDMDILQTLKNFPSVYEFDSYSKKLFSLKQNPKTASFNTIEKNTNEIIPNSSATNRNEETILNRKGHYYDQVKKLIKDRVLYKKMIKNEGSQYRSFNSKFLENFYSINKDYAEKIKNNDLLNRIVRKNITKKTNFLHRKL